ncbi:MAG: hypothetical protein HYV07_01435, partial [Deltaproteobacteria bacterium]|nr:hypothetical protein [Deltaproteobacteria bacterium]
IPDAKVLRLDRDVTQNEGALAETLAAFRNREANVLVGTQMVAKGHDFPEVTLVGILLADASLAVPDFRAVGYQVLIRGHRGWCQPRRVGGGEVGVVVPRRVV